MAPNFLLSHMRLHHAKHHIGSNVLCGQDGCPRSFDNFRYLKSHLIKNHSHLFTSETNVTFVVQDDIEQNMETVESSDFPSSDFAFSDFASSADDSSTVMSEHDLTTSFMCLLGHLECQANISQANIQTVVDNMH